MVATKLEVFEALAEGPLSLNEVAEKCKTDQTGTLRHSAKNKSPNSIKFDMHFHAGAWEREIP